MRTLEKGIVYDAGAVSRILGLPVECSEPIPQAAEGQFVIYYGGWTLEQLRESPAGKQRMWQDQDWYDKYQWRADSGYYRLRLPVPDSNRKTFAEQKTLLLPDVDVAPVCVAATALLVHLMQSGADLLSSDWCRCAEQLSDGGHAELDVGGGRVVVRSYWDDGRSDRVWLVGARKC